MKTSLLIIIGASAATLVVIVAVAILIFRSKRRRNYPAIVHEKWLDVQRLCSSKETWALAVINADKLLEDALKRTRFKGKSIGERLVAAQRKLSDNDGVWFAHNLSKKLIAETNSKLREADVKKALIGVRQALRDLGAMNDK